MEFLARRLIWLIQRFSLQNIRRLGKAIGLGLYTFSSARRQIALSNLDLAYGDTLSREEKVAIAKSSFINLATMGLEFCWMPVCTQPVDEIIRIDNPEVPLKSYREGKGLMVVLPHMGNWEIEARWFPANGYSMFGCPIGQCVSKSKGPVFVNTSCARMQAVKFSLPNSRRRRFS